MTALLLMECCLLVVAPTVQGDPLKGQEWVPFEAMTDEFNGETFDAEKWYDYNPFWQGRPPVLFHTDCVSADKGLLQIRAFDGAESAKRKLPDGFTHVSGFVRS